MINNSHDFCLYDAKVLFYCAAYLHHSIYYIFSIVTSNFMSLFL